jgi:phage repressor protein C with HTH and peptisase S24 domain
MREALGYSQDELAILLDLKKNPESTNTNISKYERGVSKPSAEVFEKLSQKLKVNINWLLTGEGEMFLPDAPVPVPRETPADKGDVADLRTGLADISRKLDALSQLPGKEPAAPVNPWKSKVLSLIKKANERTEPLFSTRQKKPKVALPVGAGKQYVTIEDLFSDEDVEIDCPEKVDYVVTVDGHSMEPLILDGSDLYVRNSYLEPYDNGDIAIVHVDDKQEYMVRRLWFHQRDNIIDIGLQSENPRGIEWHFWRDIEDEDTSSMVKLLGKVVGPNNP